MNDPGWWSSPKGMECETHHNRFTREKIHVRVVRRALACHARLKVKALTRCRRCAGAERPFILLL